MFLIVGALALALQASPGTMSDEQLGALVGKLSAKAKGATVTEQPSAGRSQPPAPLTPPRAAVMPSEAELSAARAGVADELRDPPSAYFRNVTVRANAQGTVVICGEVAGRNGYGGMGQGNPFYHLSGITFLESSPTMRQFVYDQCAGYPYVLGSLDWNK